MLGHRTDAVAPGRSLCKWLRSVRSCHCEATCRPYHVHPTARYPNNDAYPAIDCQAHCHQAGCLVHRPGTHWVWCRGGGRFGGCRRYACQPGQAGPGAAGPGGGRVQGGPGRRRCACGECGRLRRGPFRRAGWQRPRSRRRSSRQCPLAPVRRDSPLIDHWPRRRTRGRLGAMWAAEVGQQAGSNVLRGGDHGLHGGHLGIAEIPRSSEAGGSMRELPPQVGTRRPTPAGPTVVPIWRSSLSAVGHPADNCRVDAAPRQRPADDPCLYALR